MPWKHWIIDKIKPTSWSAHAAWGCVVGGAFAVWFREYPPGYVIAFAGIAATGVGLLWELGYWWLKSADATGGTVTFTDRGWPETPPNSWVQTWMISSGIEGSERDTDALPPPELEKLVRDESNGWIRSPRAYVVRVLIWRHPGLDKRLPSKMDMVPWPVWGLIGAAFVCWRV